MSEQILSQEEIDILVRGKTAREKQEETLSDLEKDAIGEVANISMGAAATTLSSLIGKRVEITTPRVTITTRSELQTEYPLPYVVVSVRYTAGLTGENLLVIKKQDAAVIVDLMMGGDASNPPEELNDLHLSAVSEAMNQMMGSAATSMSTIFHQTVNISPPSLRLINFAKEQLDPTIEYGNEQLVKIVFQISIENLIKSEMMQIIPLHFAKEMSLGLLGEFEEKIPSEPKESKTKETETASYSEPEIPIKPGNSHITAARQEVAAGSVMVQPVEFASFSATSTPKETANLTLILDVPLQFTVELGRTQKTIKEILELGPGAIVELDKLAGEPVDILVNGKPIAKGEVVVIDESYGVRITEILSTADRVSSLQ
ncbi:MAG: flagellar motor switch phosphatase FliY [Bacillota bacterium]|nr:flagellar motor switch phosphatase FliY [Bacillota bacterium]